MLRHGGHGCGGDPVADTHANGYASAKLHTNPYRHTHANTYTHTDAWSKDGPSSRL
jgi:hypothetical protein